MRTWFVIALAGCTGDEWVRPRPTETGLDPEVVDRIVQVTEPSADVLFVIDDSGSMEDDQVALAEEVPRFVQTLDDWGVDYHVGVTTTDTDDAATRGRLVLADGVRFVTPALPDPVGTLGRMARVGTSGAGVERGLLAAWLTLEVNRNSDENRGFLRPGVALSTVVVSDEDDETDGEVTLSEFVDWYRGLRDDPADRTFSSVVALQSVGRSRRGSRYLSVTSQVGGNVWDITDGAWDDVLDGLGLRTAGLRDEFVLSEVPDPETLAVSIERGSADVAVRGFRYEPVRNAVELDVTPLPGDVVVVSYRRP